MLPLQFPELTGFTIPVSGLTQELIFAERSISPPDQSGESHLLIVSFFKVIIVSFCQIALLEGSRLAAWSKSSDLWDTDSKTAGAV